MRDRLIELIKKGIAKYTLELMTSNIKYVTGISQEEIIADYLLENGVIVPHCKLGDTLYVAFKELLGKVEEIHIKGIEMCRYDNQPDFVLFVYEAEVTTGKRNGERIKFVGSCFGRNEVCFSKELAEQALKEGDE